MMAPGQSHAQAAQVKASALLLPLLPLLLLLLLLSPQERFKDQVLGRVKVPVLDVANAGRIKKM
jgi:hypothetical protein